jgi:hypothetical protein
MLISQQLHARLSLIVVCSFTSGALLSEATFGQVNNGVRKLAPGVITEIQPDIQEEETFSGPREVVELVQGAPQLDWKPNLSTQSDTLLTLAKSTTFRRQVWGLEFGFKPLRMINVDIPQPDGTKVPTPVMYLVYYVRNNGRHLNPLPQPDALGRATYTIEPVNHSIRFFPNFILQCHDYDRAYLDKVIPAAVEKIRQREDPNREFFNSVTISNVDIPISTDLEDNSVWGIATWIGVEPRSDFFSIYVRGLTNAYRWQDPEGEFKPGDKPGTGRRFSYKTLQLNYWRPGDSINVNEREFRYGVPNKTQLPSGKTEDDILKLYRITERVDYQWIYR